MLLALFRLLSYLPLPVLHVLGILLGGVVYCVSPAYRTRLRAHVRQAGFADVLGRAIGEAGKSIAELPFIWCAAPARVLATARVEGWETVQAALDAHAGVIFLTPHLGCFEIIAQTIAARTPLTALYRPPRKAFLKPLIEDARARHNLLLAPANLGGVRQMVRALKQGQAVGLLPDQVPQQGEGVWAPFFNRPAYTMTLSAKLQQMTGAPIVLAYAERLSFGRGFVVRFEPLRAALGDTPEAQAGAINRAMEELIARHPAQYFWSYHRYKVPSGVRAPTDASGEHPA